MNSKRLIVIAGPTAVGKTDVSLRLAAHYKAEIISADSRQIYRELEIGTAKPTRDELIQIRHHFINTHSIHDSYDAGSYGRDSLELIHKLFQKVDTLILCGGSGLYIKAVLEGFDEMPFIPEGTRERIIDEYQQKGLTWLQERVREVDPDYFSMVDKRNPHRLIRALELYTVAQIPLNQLRAKKKVAHPFRVIKIGIELEREQLYQRIDTRMDLMIAKGLFDEAKKFYPQRGLNALQTVGYREIFDYMEGKYDTEEAIRLLKRNTRRYAKRQLTWFKKDQGIKWFQPDQIGQMIRSIDK